MKFVKRISLFFIMPMGMYAFGFYSHMKLEEEFYPGKFRQMEMEEKSAAAEGEPQVIPTVLEDEQVISADTQYIIEEVDLQKGTSVETKWKTPDKYIGMNRQRFVKEMELYQQSPSLKDQELGFVSKIIKKHAGHTFKQLLQMKRLHQAAFLLSTTALPVEDIIALTGYDNTSYFHRIFREYYHMTPRVYRLQSSSPAR